MLRILTIVASILYCVSGYTPCRRVQPASVDEDWFMQAGSKGMHIPLHSRCNNCENEENWKWVKNDPQAKARSIMTKREAGGDHIFCWEFSGTTKFTSTGTVRIEHQCEHRGSVGEQYCQGVIPRYKVGEMKYAGSNTIIKTDNSTYVAGVTCMFGRENFWWIAYTSTDPPADTVKSLEEFFQTLGFKAVTATLEHKAPVILKEMKMTEC